MDIGIVAGAGIGYQMEKGMLFARGSLRGRHEDDRRARTRSGRRAADVKNSVISIMVGYGFAF